MSDKYDEVAEKLVRPSIGVSYIVEEKIKNVAAILRASFPPDDGAEGWIKCGERLPELGKTVLVTGEGWVGTDARFQHPEEVRDWWRNSEGEIIITHWRELPAPPKEQP